MEKPTERLETDDNGLVDCRNGLPDGFAGTRATVAQLRKLHVPHWKAFKVLDETRPNRKFVFNLIPTECNGVVEDYLAGARKKAKSTRRVKDGLQEPRED